ncbi:MAG TPA: CoA transferase [Frankiaceae bacterium]|nr:CoA transferase [Frankiaceae bacterium]
MNGPLSGVRVLDLSVMLSGPFATSLLGDQGADVIKLERPGTGDIARMLGVSVNGVSAMFVACNRGKRSIVVDLQQPDGAEIVRRIAAGVDVFVQNFRPGVMDRIGIGYEAIRRINPEVIYTSISAFGAEGPYRRRAAYDPVIQSYSGFAMNQSDPDDGAPVFLRQSGADKVTSLFASQAITAALFARERGQGGQHLELSMMDAAVSFLWADAAGNEVLLGSDGSLPSSPVAGLHPVRFADGWGSVSPTTDRDFAAICRVFGIELSLAERVTTMTERMKNRAAANEVVDLWHARAANMTMAEADALLSAEGLSFAWVMTNQTLVQDRHARDVGLFEEFDHPMAGKARLPRHPTRFGSTEAKLGTPSPLLGEHTDEILEGIGIGSEIAGLRARGVVA